MRKQAGLLNHLEDFNHKVFDYLPESLPGINLEGFYCWISSYSLNIYSNMNLILIYHTAEPMSNIRLFWGVQRQKF